MTFEPYSEPQGSNSILQRFSGLAQMWNMRRQMQEDDRTLQTRQALVPWALKLGEEDGYTPENLRRASQATAPYDPGYAVEVAREASRLTEVERKRHGEVAADMGAMFHGLKTEDDYERTLDVLEGHGHNVDEYRGNWDNVDVYIKEAMTIAQVSAQTFTDTPIETPEDKVGEYVQRQRYDSVKDEWLDVGPPTLSRTGQDTALMKNAQFAMDTFGWDKKRALTWAKQSATKSDEEIFAEIYDYYLTKRYRGRTPERARDAALEAMKEYRAGVGALSGPEATPEPRPAPEGAGTETGEPVIEPEAAAPIPETWAPDPEDERPAFEQYMDIPLAQKEAMLQPGAEDNPLDELPETFTEEHVGQFYNWGEGKYVVRRQPDDTYKLAGPIKGAQ